MANDRSDHRGIFPFSQKMNDRFGIGMSTEAVTAFFQITTKFQIVNISPLNTTQSVPSSFEIGCAPPQPQ
jgi:hypothetical protein